MPDLGPLLEREMQEIRPAGYTIADVARRRERRGRNRRIGASAVALVIAVATIGGFMLAFRHVPSAVPGGQGSATPSATTAPSVLTLAESACPDYSCWGPLVPGGQYRATYYDTIIAFEIASPGWKWTYTGNFVIEAAESEARYSPDGIYFFMDPAIASQDCTDAAEPGVGRSADELAAWLEAAPGLAVSDPTPVTVGGLSGVQLDLQLDPGWKKTCFYSDGKPTVPLIFSGADIGGYNWAISGIKPWMRWYILDSDQGAIIVDIEDNPGGASREELIRTGTGIVDSIAFSPPS